MMGVGEFRGDEKHLPSEIEEMAHVVYGLPKNDLSKTISQNTANLLRTLSNVKFEKEEEPHLPRLPGKPPLDGKGGDKND
jgi:hypothetical protein